MHHGLFSSSLFLVFSASLILFPPLSFTLLLVVFLLPFSPLDSFLLLISWMISSAAAFFQLLCTPANFFFFQYPLLNATSPAAAGRCKMPFFCSFLCVREVFSFLSFEMGRGQLPKDWHHSLALQGKTCGDPSESWQVSCLLSPEVTECFTHHLGNEYRKEHTGYWPSLFSSFLASLKYMCAQTGINHRVFLSIAELFLKKSSLVVVCALWDVHG